MVDRHLHCLASWLTILLQTHSVYGYYCDNDRCDFDEYCCGHNICCTSYNVWQMWYFWLGLVIFLILLAGCFSFWRYRYQQALVVQMCTHTGYNPLVPSSQVNIPSHVISVPTGASGAHRAAELSYTPQQFAGKNGIHQLPGVYT